MKSAFKWTGIVVGIVIGLIVLATLSLYSLGQMRLKKIYEVPTHIVALPTDADSLAEGKRIFQYRVLDEEGQCSFNNADEKIDVLQYVPSTYHVDLDEDPNHQTQPEHRPEITCIGVSLYGQYSGCKLADAVNKEQNDAGKKEIMEGGILQHVWGRLEKRPRGTDNQERTADDSP